MKKQILLLTFFTLAILFAGNFSASAQTPVETPHWSDSRIVACQADALHPQPGVSYDYSGFVDDPSTGTGGGWRFWATRDPNFIVTTPANDPNGTIDMNFDDALAVGAGELLATSTDYNIEIGQATADDDGTVSITWTATLLNLTEYQVSPTFVVAYYVNNEGCTDNIKVWELDPINPFVVDVIAMDAADLAGSINDYDVTPETCVDVVESATYATGLVSYDFGDNYLYFEFVASNYADYWVPTFELTGLLGDQSITSYEYTTATPDTWGTTAPSWTVLETGTTQLSQATGVTDVTESSSIFVRVRVDHNHYENLAGQNLTMTLDGQDQAGFWDVVNDDCDAPVPNEADKYDTATSTITPRPDIQRAGSTKSPITPNIQMIDGDQQ